MNTVRDDKLKKREWIGAIAFNLHLIYIIVSNGLGFALGSAPAWKTFLMHPGNWLLILILGGSFCRKQWTRTLWLLSNVFWFMYTVIFNLWARPHAEENSPAGIAYHLIWIAVVIWVYRSRWLSNVLNRPGRKIWVRLGTGYYIFCLTALCSVIIATYRWAGNHPIEKVSIPEFSPESQIPAGWTETECFGYVIPVPAKRTENFAIEEGVDTYRFKEMDGTNFIRSVMMCSPSLPVHKALDSVLGTSSLRTYYSQFYERRFSMPYTLNTYTLSRLKAGAPSVGFTSHNETDLMAELLGAQTREWHTICISLEDRSTKEYHEINLQKQKPWPLKERLSLISRIRKAE